MKTKKHKTGYKTKGTVTDKKYTPLDLDSLLLKRKKIDEQIEMAKKRWIKGKPSTIRRGSKYVKKGGKV